MQSVVLYMSSWPCCAQSGWARFDFDFSLILLALSSLAVCGLSLELYLATLISSAIPSVRPQMFKGLK